MSDASPPPRPGFLDDHQGNASSMRLMSMVALIASIAFGDDIRELHTGYRNTVGLYFAQLRQSGLTVIEETWVPAYLDSFVEGGGLRDIVAEGNRDDLRAWARAAIEDIDARRTEFVDSLNAREIALLIKIDDAFARTIHASQGTGRSRRGTSTRRGKEPARRRTRPWATNSTASSPARTSCSRCLRP